MDVKQRPSLCDNLACAATQRTTSASDMAIYRHASSLSASDHWIGPDSRQCLGFVKMANLGRHKHTLGSTSRLLLGNEVSHEGHATVNTIR